MEPRCQTVLTALQLYLGVADSSPRSTQESRFTLTLSKALVGLKHNRSITVTEVTPRELNQGCAMWNGLVTKNYI